MQINIIIYFKIRVVCSFFCPKSKISIFKVCLDQGFAGQGHLVQGPTAMPFNQSSAKLGDFLVHRTCVADSGLN